jgi:ABC-type multidrug transport system ATPase subunit
MFFTIGLLLLDEPTSGLDSFTAYKIVKLLQNIAQDEQKVIVATIHQVMYTISLLTLI